MRDTIKKWIQDIFSPFHSFLDIAIENLKNIGLVSAQGLDIGNYLSVFGDMPQAWQLVITSLLGSVGLLGALLIFRSIMRIYYSMKEGVKWW